MTPPPLKQTTPCPYCGKVFEPWQGRSFRVHILECLRRKVAARSKEG